MYSYMFVLGWNGMFFVFQVVSPLHKIPYFMHDPLAPSRVECVCVCILLTENYRSIAPGRDCRLVQTYRFHFCLVSSFASTSCPQRPSHAGGCHLVRGDAETGAAVKWNLPSHQVALVCTGGCKQKSRHGCTSCEWMQVVCDFCI